MSDLRHFMMWFWTAGWSPTNQFPRSVHKVTALPCVMKNFDCLGILKFPVRNNVVPILTSNSPFLGRQRSNDLYPKYNTSPLPKRTGYLYVPTPNHDNHPVCVSPSSRRSFPSTQDLETDLHLSVAKPGWREPSSPPPCTIAEEASPSIRNPRAAPTDAKVNPAVRPNLGASLENIVRCGRLVRTMGVGGVGVKGWNVVELRT